MALLTFMLSWNDWNRQLDVRLVADASEMTRVIHVHLADNEQSLLAVRALFATAPQIDRTKFRQFTTPFLDRLPSTQAIAWVSRVPADTRAAYEQASDISVFKQDVNGIHVPASNRAEYFPVTFIEPFAVNRTILGLDMGSMPDELQTIIRARDSGQSTLTPPFHLVQTTDELKMPSTRSTHTILNCICLTLAILSHNCSHFIHRAPARKLCPQAQRLI
ncbi:MAG: CHASE domain-containing protein [Chloroflexales bacterium]